DNMRRIQGAVQELLNVDHIADKTGTEVSAADSGEHRKVLFHAPIAATPTVAENHGDLRIKDVGGKAELAWTDEDENELILTNKGNNLANATYLKATDEAGTGSVDLIKAGKNVADDTNVAIVPDLTRTASNAAPIENTDLANKKYVDDQLAFSAMVSDDADSAALAAGTTYTATSDGFIMVKAAKSGTDTNITVSIAGVDFQIRQAGTATTGRTVYGCFPVASGETILITDGSTVDSFVIRWRSRGPISKLTK
ncbi:hypothetical protein LCGC14_2351720, partial [marine sediment metagenome]